MFDKLRFQYEIKRNGYSLKEIASLLDIDIATLYRKMNGDSDFYRREIQILCKNIHFENPMEIFFAEKIT